MLGRKMSKHSISLLVTASMVVMAVTMLSDASHETRPSRRHKAARADQEPLCPACKRCEPCEPPTNCPKKTRKCVEYDWSTACQCSDWRRVSPKKNSGDQAGAKNATQMINKPKEPYFCPTCPPCPGCKKCPTPPICESPELILPECDDCCPHHERCEHPPWWWAGR